MGLGLTALDIILLVAIAIGAVRGGLRGFVQESLSLAALIAALFAVSLLHEPVTELLIDHIGSESGASVLAFVLIMAIIWGGGKLAAARIGRATRNSVIGPADRILGAGFGTLKALLLVTALFMVSTLAYDLIYGSDAERPEWMARSRSFPLLSATGSALSDLVAQRLADEPADEPAGEPSRE